MRKRVWIAVGVLLACGTIWAQQYLITTVAGGGIPIPPTPAAALSAGLPLPMAATVDLPGNVYFSAGNCVFKVDRSGVLTRVAGSGIAGYSGDGGPATSAQLNNPWGIAADASGNIYVADGGNLRIRKVAVDGTITTMAGDGTPGISGDGGPATSAQFLSPTGVGVDGAGNVYIMDENALALRRVAPDGTIATVASVGGDELAVNAAGDVYISSSEGNTVYKVAVDGTITTVAGNGNPGYSGDGGPATSAELQLPLGVALDSIGNLYIADYGNSRVRKVGVDGTITTVAGNGTSSYSGDGGPATNAQLGPRGVAVDASGNLFIADAANKRVRKVAVGGTITTVAGNGAVYLGDGGPATSAQLNSPYGVALDAAGNLYIADSGDYRIRKVAADSTITTVAGNGAAGAAGDGGPATSAQLNSPSGVAWDSAGDLYIDSYDGAIRKVGPSGTITTVATGGVGVAVDAAGYLYIAGGLVIRKMGNGIIGTVAGNGIPGYSGDGGLATSAEMFPVSVAVDTAGNLYIGDDGPYTIYNPFPRPWLVYNEVVRKVGLDGAIATIARADHPIALAVDGAGNLYIANGDAPYILTSNAVQAGIWRGSNVVTRVAPDGTTTTVAGSGVAGYSGDGGPATSAQLNSPSGVAVDAAGNVYIGDTDNNVIRLLVPAGKRALLSVTSTHSGDFAPGQAGATFVVVVSNAAGAGPTSGAVTVKEVASLGLTVVSMSGPGWTCSNGTCTRSDVLNPGSSYPAITVTVSVAADAPSQVTGQVAVSGGGSVGTSATDPAVVLAPPQAPVLVSPANEVTDVLASPLLSWGASFGTVSYDVYFGTSSSPPLVSNTAGTSFAPGALNPDATYYWQIVARNPSGSASSATWSFTTAAIAGMRFVAVTPCRVADTRGPGGPFGGPGLGGGRVRSFAVPQGGCGIPGTARAYSLNVTVVPKGPLGYLTLWPAGQVQPLVSTLNSWSGQVVANAAIVPAGSGGAVSVFALDPTDVILDIDGYFDTSSGANSFGYYTARPCRVADTRSPAGVLGGPSMSANQSRDFPIPSSFCGIPSGAGAYSLNVTAVPDPTVDYLGYLTAWPTGQAQPLVSTLNSWTGKVVANAAIVPSGTNGSVSVFVTNPTDVILDTNGYFAAPAGAGALTFYPVTPCRVADTRGVRGPFGGPAMGTGETRSFTIPASACPIPATAAAYSLNVTVVPGGVLSYLSTWPAGSAQPLVSTLNSFDGSVVANAAIVPAGTGGAIDVFVTNPTDVILDINGYFAP